jgi:hypothetical protein
MVSNTLIAQYFVLVKVWNWSFMFINHIWLCSSHYQNRLMVATTIANITDSVAIVAFVIVMTLIMAVTLI